MNLGELEQSNKHLLQWDCWFSQMENPFCFGQKLMTDLWLVITIWTNLKANWSLCANIVSKLMYWKKVNMEEICYLICTTLYTNLDRPFLSRGLSLLTCGDSPHSNAYEPHCTVSIFIKIHDIYLTILFYFILMNKCFIKPKLNSLQTLQRTESKLLTKIAANKDQTQPINNNQQKLNQQPQTWQQSNYRRQKNPSKAEKRPQEQKPLSSNIQKPSTL
jgi:hypothetical protein